MRSDIHFPALRVTLAAALLAGSGSVANADPVIEWNVKAGEIIVQSRLGTPPAIRVMAIVQTAVHEAVDTLASAPSAARQQPVPAADAAFDAAVAAANRATLARLLPSQQASIDTAYRAAMATIADGPAKTRGTAAGERAAAAVLAARADDGAAAKEAYRPHTTAGAYVPTALPAVPQWPQRKPWLMSSAAQFRPPPPPALSSDTWARGQTPGEAIGSRNSSSRSAEQTEIASFWEFSLPSIYFGVVHSVGRLPGRTPAGNARLLAAASQAMDDAMIAVFDAKYHYNFWRPATAIRNAEIDGHPATERDASWVPFIDTPMHPEYPSAHSILAAAVGAVLQAAIGDGPMPVLTTTSPTLKGAARSWASLEAFVQEVASARIYEGVHYRFSVDTGIAMGRQIGQLAVARHLHALD